MSKFSDSVTTTALLDALAGQDQAAWTELDERWRPVVFNLARRLGLADEDSADVAQEALVDFYRDFQQGRFDRKRGRMRAWLLGIAHNRARDRGRKDARQRGQRGESLLETLAEPGQSELERIWQEELEEEVLRRAFSVLRNESETDAKSIAVFEDYVLRDRPASEVAALHGIAVASVYSIKSRCLERLTELKARIFEAYGE